MSKSRLTVRSMRNTEFISVLLLIIVLFCTQTTVNLLLPHPVHPKECIVLQRYMLSKIFFHLKFIKIIFHADSAHFIHKFEESNATTAGGYSAKWLPTGTTEMEARRHACVYVGKSNGPDGKEPFAGVIFINYHLSDLIKYRD